MRGLHMAVGLAGIVTGCGGAPPSRLPDGQAAIDRMRASYGCTAGVQIDEAKVDAFGNGQRVRTDVMMLAASPSRFRLDAKTPVAGDVAAVITSDGTTLASSDLRQGRFTSGPANACGFANVAKIAVPPAVLVTLLLGHAPVLVHSSPPTLRWSSGRYLVGIDGTNGSREEIELQPWTNQRLRVARVHVEQQGATLYDAELADPQPAPAATGDRCDDAEIPRSVHLSVPPAGEDILIRTTKVVVNPSLDPTVFTQSSQPGMTTERLTCVTAPGSSTSP